MSLTDCIKKAGKAISNADAKYLANKYKALLNEGLDDADAGIRAINSLDNIIGKDIKGVLKKAGIKQSIGQSAKGLRSPFKARKFLIPDELVEQFLERDIEELAHLYLRNTVPDMEIIKRFGDNKTTADEVLSFEIQKSDIERDFRNLMDSAKTDKERLRLSKEKDNVIKSLLGMRDRIRGVYDVPDGAPSLGRRINTAARNLNYVRLLGGVAASSIPDMGKLIISEGFQRAFGDGLGPLVRNISKFKLDAKVKNEFRYMGTALETITSGRVEAMADINNYAMGNTKFERGLEYVSGKFGHLSLMNQWNDTMKTAHALSMQARVYDDLAKGKFDNRLSRLGLTEDEANKIYALAKKHGEKNNGARLFHPEKWEDQEMAFAWAAALRKESDRVIIIPGQEKPLFMSRDMGKTLLQFRSFMLSSTQRTLLSIAQGQEVNAVGGMLSMVTLGSMVYAFKQWNAGRDISDDPRVWVAEGIDRSGVLGIIMEASNTAEKVSGNRFGLRGLIGIAEPASRFSSRNETEAILGPTYGSLLSTGFSVARAGLDENEWKESDTSNLRRMLPFQNLLYLRRGIDAAEENIHKGITQ